MAASLICGIVEIWHPDDFLFSEQEQAEWKARAVQKGGRSKTEIFKAIPHACQRVPACEGSGEFSAPVVGPTGTKEYLPLGYVEGRSLVGVLSHGDPRLVHLARRKMPHWKIAFRGLWYNTAGQVDTASRLDEARRARLFDSIGAVKLKVKGVYRNPTYDEWSEYEEWVLIAFGPWTPDVERVSSVKFSWSDDGTEAGRLWVSW